MNNDYYGMYIPPGMVCSDYDANKQMPGGSMHDGVQMSRTQSGASNESRDIEDPTTSSFSNGRTSDIESGDVSMVEVNSLHSLELNQSYPQQQYNSTYEAFQQPYDVRPTPSSLGWAKRRGGPELATLYAFTMPKGKSPYLQLQDQWTPTSMTPAIVYLDEPKEVQMNQFPCMYPGLCNGKQNFFGRQADLERHYKNMHCSRDEPEPHSKNVLGGREVFACDYRRCHRFKEPFSRKDHCLDHLRYFHQEDFGRPQRRRKGKLETKDKEEL